MELPVARDFDGVRLTPEQIRQINYAIDQVEIGRYSYKYVKELVELGRKSLQRAYAENDEERIDELGKEVQVYNHILNTCFSNRGDKHKDLRPDPKHLAYLAIIEGRVCPAGYTMDHWVNLVGGKSGSRTEAWDLIKHYNNGCLTCQRTVGNIDPALVVRTGVTPEVTQFTNKMFPVVAAPDIQTVEIAQEQPDDILSGLPPEVRADIDPISSNPQVAAIQNKLINLIQELRIAMEDREPAFVISKIQRQIASTHEQLVAVRSHSSKRYSRRRYY